MRIRSQFLRAVRGCCRIKSLDTLYLLFKFASIMASALQNRTRVAPNRAGDLAEKRAIRRESKILYFIVHIITIRPTNVSM